MISAEQAMKCVLENLPRTCTEQVVLADGLGRVLAEDIIARLTQPWSDVSAMDGYAVRAQDVTSVPVTLNVIGESPAGGAFAGQLGAGQSVRIFTGAPLPQGADAIVIQEDTERDGDTVKILEGAPKGKFVRPAGLDFKAGAALIEAPKVLNPRDLGLAAAANVPWLTVKRRPRIAFIATGNEVVMPGDPLGANQIVSSNSVMLKAFIQTLGAEPLDLGIARDDEASLTRLIKSAGEADMLVTIGGASVGDYDLVGRVLAQQGMKLQFDKVAMRPGKPLIFGHLNGTPVLGMPGNPVSVGVAAAVVLRAAVNVMLGLDAGITLESAKLGRDLGENDQRQEYMRASLSVDANGDLTATPFDKQDSSMLARFREADCLVIRPAFAPPAKAGTLVEIIRL
jgi:molybdopterin molybdotransferase